MLDDVLQVRFGQTEIRFQSRITSFQLELGQIYARTSPLSTVSSTLQTKENRT